MMLAKRYAKPVTAESMAVSTSAWVSARAAGGPVGCHACPLAVAAHTAHRLFVDRGERARGLWSSRTVVMQTNDDSMMVAPRATAAVLCVIAL